jgi:dTDP-4-dehydrorhamnose reductase
LVHLSTDYVFDSRKSSPYTEDDAAAPLGVYGRSKLEGEVAVRKACPTALVLRTSWIYSPYAHNFVTVTSLIAIKSTEYPAPARRPANSRLDCAKIERQFGIRLPSWQRSLDACLERPLAEGKRQPC